MNTFEFAPRELPAVMRGPRVERRRVLQGGTPCWGTVVDGGRLRLDDGREVALEGLMHLPPCEPSKIIAVHLSYSSRGIESRNLPKPTPTPTYFSKPTTALNGHGGEIVKPADCRYLNYEGEFAVVIGSVCRNVTPDEAWERMLGFAPALDMGLQDFRDTDQGSMLRVKGADTLLPIGPGIVRGVNLFEQTLRTYVNGRVVQEAHIGEETIWGLALRDRRHRPPHHAAAWQRDPDGHALSLAQRRPRADGGVRDHRHRPTGRHRDGHRCAACLGAGRGPSTHRQRRSAPRRARLR